MPVNNSNFVQNVSPPISTNPNVQTVPPANRTYAMTLPPEMNDIRDYYDRNRGDIYSYATYEARETLERIGKYNFESKPPKNLEIQQLTFYNDGSKYFGQINPRTNNKEGHGIKVYKIGGIYEGLFKSNKMHGKGRII